MKNFYYFSFYFLSAFFKTVNKKDNDYAFTGMTFFSMLVGLNLLTILLIVINDIAHKINITILSILIALPIMGINYYLLISNNKSKNIIKEYENEWALNRKKGTIYLALFLFYAIVSIISSGYVAYLVRNHLL